MCLSLDQKRIVRIGSIASAQESLTLVAGKSIPLLMVTLSLILAASHSHAGLGCTLAEIKQQYGEPVLNQEQIAGRTGYGCQGAASRVLSSGGLGFASPAIHSSARCRMACLSILPEWPSVRFSRMNTCFGH